MRRVLVGLVVLGLVGVAPAEARKHHRHHRARVAVVVKDRVPEFALPPGLAPVERPPSFG